VPGQRAQDVVPLPPNGSCPFGWLRSGSFLSAAREPTSVGGSALPGEAPRPRLFWWVLPGRFPTPGNREATQHNRLSFLRFQPLASLFVVADIQRQAPTSRRSPARRAQQLDHLRDRDAVCGGGASVTPSPVRPEQFERTAPSSGRDALARAAAWVA
jgi:hypothetical protein